MGGSLAAFVQTPKELGVRGFLVFAAQVGQEIDAIVGTIGGQGNIRASQRCGEDVQRTSLARGSIGRQHRDDDMVQFLSQMPCAGFTAKIVEPGFCRSFHVNRTQWRPSSLQIRVPSPGAGHWFDPNFKIFRAFGAFGSTTLAFPPWVARTNDQWPPS